MQRGGYFFRLPQIPRFFLVVTGASINDMRRLLSDPDTGKKCGVSRIYSRIFWLEKTLLAFERAKLREWKAREEAAGRFLHMRDSVAQIV